MKPTFIPIEEIKAGVFFTVHAEPTAYQQGIVASGKIFRCRELAYPFVFADYYTGPNTWIDSPWVLNLDQGINLIKLTTNAPFRLRPVKQKKHKRKH